MQLKPVVSSNVVAVGYEPAGGQLVVQFKSPGYYRYDGVPQSFYFALLASPSIGKFLNMEIQPRFPVTKLGRVILQLPLAVQDDIRIREGGAIDCGEDDDPVVAG